jgi:hypothetical protein
MGLHFQRLRLEFRLLFPGAARASPFGLEKREGVKRGWALGAEAGGADFILDVFDPEEEEDELSNER